MQQTTQYCLFSELRNANVILPLPHIGQFLILLLIIHPLALVGVASSELLVVGDFLGRNLLKQFFFRT
ncbi:hypothetical protein ABN357_19480 [Providencia rettgeri]